MGTKGPTTITREEEEDPPALHVYRVERVV